MKTFEVQYLEIDAPYEETFAFISDPGNLPRWAHAFKSVGQGKAQLETPNGKVEVRLVVHASRAMVSPGKVITQSTFPCSRAYSRVVPSPQSNGTIYAFILLPPPVPLEQLEGALSEQSRILREELRTLKNLLEASLAAEKQ